MIMFLPVLLAVALVGVIVLILDGIRKAWEARQARRVRRARAFARHPAQLARRPLRRRVPGLPVDGEPLTDDELATYTAIMITPPTGSDEARETSADEGASE